MTFVTVSSKGQVVLPARTRHRLGLNAGAKLELVEESNGLHLKVVRAVSKGDLSKLAGMVIARRKGAPRSLLSFDAIRLVSRKQQR